MKSRNETIKNRAKLFIGDGSPLTPEQRQEAYQRLYNLQEETRKQAVSSNAANFWESSQEDNLNYALELSQQIIAADILLKFNQKKQ